MKKLFICLVVLFSFGFMTNVHAEIGHQHLSAFSYNENENEAFYDIDFFPNGNYVVVGGKKYDGVSNSSGIIKIFDSNNNLLKEFEGSNANGKTGVNSEVFAVTVIDDNSFALLDDWKVMKYDINGNIIWETELSLGGLSRGHYSIEKSSDGSILFTNGWFASKMLSDGVLSKKIVNSIHPDEIKEYNNKIYILRNNTVVDSAMYIYDLDGNLISEKKFDYETYRNAYSFDFVDGNMVILFDKDIIVYNNDFDEIKKYKIESTDDKLKYINVVNDSIILTGNPSSYATIYCFDKSLNFLYKYNYSEDSSKIELYNTTVYDNKIYAVGSFKGNYLGMNSSTTDGLVMSYVSNEIQNDNINDSIEKDESNSSSDTTNDDNSDDSISNNPDEKTTILSSNTNQNSNTIKNPNTGEVEPNLLYIILGIGFVGIIAMMTKFCKSKKA